MKKRGYSILAAFFLSLAAVDGADKSAGPIVSRIAREPVNSAALSSVGYSRRLRALEIEFHDGSIYRYIDVPPVLHESLMEAQSKARYYNRALRGKYRCVRVKRPRPR